MLDNARRSKGGAMAQPDKSLYAGPVTFLGAPYTHDLTGAKAAILGVPFDCGTHPHRIGSRQGPQAMREQSAQMRLYNSELADFNPVERLKLVDCGNVKLTPGRIVDAFERIEAAVRPIYEAGVIPVTRSEEQTSELQSHSFISYA